jgi:sporulation protein YlmC with PRC-barrel domain
MTTTDYGKLVELDDVGKTVADKDEDIRGRHVIDKDGHTLGKIDALLIDDKERKVRFFQVESGGFLGLGEKKSLIPIDTIVSINADEVHIDQPGATVAAAPIYGHYGIMPFWGFGYVYPPYPRYAVGD